jgi:hypothetical protein
MPQHPSNERRDRSQQARVERQCSLIGLVDWDSDVSKTKLHRIALEEVWQVDEPLAALGISIGNELVVGQRETKDVRVDDDDASEVGTVPNDVSIEAMYGFFLALR